MQGRASLDLFDFGVLLQALSTSLKVGVLAVRSGDREKYLQLDRGKLVCVRTRRPKVSLEKVLWNYRAIEKGPLRAAIEEVEAMPEKGPLARYLVAANLVQPPQIRRAHVYQVIEEVLEVFYWKNVGFEFYSGDEPQKVLKDPLLVAVGEPMEVDSLLLQCTKAVDDISKFNEVTPSLRDVFELHLGTLGALETAVPDPIEREFLLLVDGVRDMREILRDMRLNRFDALECFYKYRVKGWLRPKNAFELLMLAENRRRDFPLEKRVRVLERVLELGVEGFQICVPLAEGYEALGQPEKAAPLYAKEARKFLSAGDADAAVRAAVRARTLMPDDASLREFEIEVLLGTGRLDEAGAAHVALARVRSASGDLAGARRSLRRAVRLAPGDAAAWGGLADAEERLDSRRRAACCRRRQADVLEKAGEIDGAVEALRRAMLLCPTAWSVRYRLADLLHAHGRRDEAVRGLADVVSAVVSRRDWPNPDLPRAHLVLIEDRLRAMRGLDLAAAEALGRAWLELGDRARAVASYYEAADTLSRAGSHASAIGLLEVLLEVDPDHHDARRLLAREQAATDDGSRALAQLRRLSGALMSAGRYQEARDTFLEMLRVDPACPDAHRGLAHALLYLGETRRAAEHYHRVGLIYRGYGQPEEAAPYLREAVDRSPADAELLEEYCELLLSMKDRRAESLQALSALVELHMSQGHPARAAIALTRILEIDRRYPGAKQILHDAAKQLLTLAEASEEIPAEECRALLEGLRRTDTRT